MTPVASLSYRAVLTETNVDAGERDERAIDVGDRWITDGRSRAVLLGYALVRRSGKSDEGFEVYLSAAMTKKQVPVTVARCIFASCAGIEDPGATTVQLQKGDTVAWSYACQQGRGQKNRQSLAEAAKHLKNEFFHVR